MIAKIVLPLLLCSLALAQEIQCPKDATLTVPDQTESTCKRIDKEGNYIPHGPSIERFTNGVKHKAGSYQNGKKSGLWTWWYPNGKKMQEAYYRDDKFIGGTLKQWDENGNMIAGQTNRFENFAGAVKKKLNKD